MSLVAFPIAAILLAVTPGPGIAYVVARTVAGGRPEGLASCLGTGAGGMLHGSVCVAFNTVVDVMAVFAADRFLKSGAARTARARLLTRVSGATMLGLGAYLALARRAD